MDVFVVTVESKRGRDGSPPEHHRVSVIEGYVLSDALSDGLRVPEGRPATWRIRSIVALPLGSGLRGLTLWARGAICHPGLFGAVMAGQRPDASGCGA